MRRWAALALALTCSTFLFGCQPAATEQLNLGFGYADVEQLEVCVYALTPPAQRATRITLTDRREISTWVDAFTDLPMRTPAMPVQLVSALDANGFRFHLRDGSTYEVTRAFAHPGATGDGLRNALVWPDGRVMATDAGSLGDFGSGESVDASQCPQVVIGG